jgi:hypothetical protein
VNKKTLRRRFIARKSLAVSEVLGALLLMVVVVVAVGTFAYYLSFLQTQSEDRQTFLNSVADDKLQVTNLQFSLNNSLIQYEIYSLANGTKYYIQMINQSAVDLINETTGRLYHSADLNSSLTGGLPFFPAYYNSINFSTIADITTYIGLTPALVWNITFVPPAAGAIWAFRTASWSNATITVRNLNIQTSGIKAIEVNGNYLSNSWYVVNDGGSIQDAYNLTSGPITFPPRASLNVLMNLTYLSIPRNESFRIVLESIANNYFTTLYSPPTALVKETVDTENYILGSRDIPSFDGSGSQASNGSAIQSFEWRIDVPNPSWKGSWSQVDSIYTNFTVGQSFQFRPEAFYSSQLLTLATAPNITGPFRVTLTTVDQYGFMATSQAVVSLPDPNISPAGSLSASGGCSSSVTVNVYDIFERPLGGVPVEFFGVDGVVPSQAFAVTNSMGVITTGCTGTGYLEIVAGSLPPIYQQET